MWREGGRWQFFVCVPRPASFCTDGSKFAMPCDDPYGAKVTFLASRTNLRHTVLPKALGRSRIVLIAVFIIWGLFATSIATAKPKNKTTHRIDFLGCCDASAAVALDDHRFVVADDESSILRMYDWNAPGMPLQTFSLKEGLNQKDGKTEADIEAAARLGDVIFWITSHANNRVGKNRPDRNRIFATTVRTNAGKFSIEFLGKPYGQLEEDLAQSPQLAAFGFKDDSKKSPKNIEGLDIEGLCATPEGTLLLGFRNPRPQGKALVVPLLNPFEVIQGQARALLGVPMQLDLEGMSIRDLFFRNGSVYILAGSWKSGHDRRIYRWDGRGSSVELVTLKTLDQYHSEALFAFPHQPSDVFAVLSDDGSRKTNGIECKNMLSVDRTFRAFEWRVTLPNQKH